MKLHLAEANIGCSKIPAGGVCITKYKTPLFVWLEFAVIRTLVQ